MSIFWVLTVGSGVGQLLGEKMETANQTSQEDTLNRDENERFALLLEQEDELLRLELSYNQWELYLSRAEEAYENLINSDVRLTKQQILQLQQELSKIEN